MTPYNILSQIVMPLLIAALYGAALCVGRGLLKRLGAMRLSRWAAAVAIGFSALDWALLAALTPLGLSYGPIGLALFAFAGSRLFLAVTLPISLRGSDRLNPHPRLSQPAKIGMAALLALNLGLLAIEIDGFYIEPFALGVTEISAPGPAPLTIVQLTDLHVERTTRREREILQTVEGLHPDLIVLTGDYLNQEFIFDPLARQAVRDLLAQLHAPLGVFAVTGSVDTPSDTTAIFDGLDITMLNDESVRLPFDSGDLYVVGVANEGLSRDRRALENLMDSIPPEAATLLLYHTPDLIETAAAEGIDLYLAGHTHGGQIRLPFYGAIVTFSAYGKQYEMGQYTLGPTTLYVSRGLGLEGLGLPRVRFLCPPEMVVVNLKHSP